MNNLWILLSFLIMILTASKVICMGLISRLNYNKDIMLCIVYILICILLLMEVFFCSQK